MTDHSTSAAMHTSSLLDGQCVLGEQAEADFSSLAERVREGDVRAAETDKAAREALHRCAQAEAQLQSTEVHTCCHVAL